MEGEKPRPFLCFYAAIYYVIRTLVLPHVANVHFRPLVQPLFKQLLPDPSPRRADFVNRVINEDFVSHGRKTDVASVLSNFCSRSKTD